jgi:phage gp29-like protein
MQPIKDYITTTKSFFFGAFKAETKTPTGQKKDSVIISQLAKEFTDRSRADIQKWRQSISAAENPETPNWALYQDLLENLMNDGHLMAAIDLRKAATLSSRFLIKDKTTGKEVPEKTDWLKTEWFYNIMDNALDAVFRYYSVIELADPVFYNWVLWPRRNIVPQKTTLLFEANGEKGINYSDPVFAKNVLEIKHNRMFGILNDIIPQLIWKRNAQQAWADFAERFGIPLVTAETTTRDRKELDRIEAMLKKLGQAAQAVLPEGTKIVIHDSSTKGDPHKIFDEQIKRANYEISKRILGGTMILDDGSSRSQSEVHERTLDGKIAESDRRMIEFFVNGKLIPLLKNWGFAFGDNETFAFDRTEEMSLADHWKIVYEASDFYEIDENWVGERFNMKITGKKTKSVVGTPTN